jgi:hypothetical protein
MRLMLRVGGLRRPTRLARLLLYYQASAASVPHGVQAAKGRSTMCRSILTAAALVLVAASSSFAQTSPCTTVKPGADWVCIQGGWVPANQVPPTPTVDVPKPHQPTPDVPFRIGRRYWRNASGVNPTDIYISGAGQLEDGTSVLFAVCRLVGDGCYSVGEVRLFLSNSSARDWEDRTNSPY